MNGDLSLKVGQVSVLPTLRVSCSRSPLTHGETPLYAGGAFPICLCSEFNVITGIFGNVVKECFQILGQFWRWESVILGMVILLKDEPM